MCLIALALDQHPNYSLILCANRDEFHKRPTKEAHYWKEENQQLFAGRDLEQGGTWLGVTTSGKLAAVTNVRSPELKAQHHLSRGEIVTNYLKNPVTPEEYSEEMKKKGSLYQGYNAIVGLGEECVYFSNRIEESVKLDVGIHTLSNASLNTNWPKTVRVKEGLREIIERKEGEERIIESLLLMLKDETVASKEHLPNTGVGLEMERTLSPIFINGEFYGTRASTIVLMNRNGGITFVEQTYHSNAIQGKRVIERIEMEKLT